MLLVVFYNVSSPANSGPYCDGTTQCTVDSSCPASIVVGDRCLYGNPDCDPLCCAVWGTPNCGVGKQCSYDNSQTKMPCHPQCQSGPSCTSYPGGWNCLNANEGGYCDYFPCLTGSGGGSCPGTCSSGVCVQSTATPTCSDPDSSDAYTYGTCVDNTATYNDYCSSGYDNRVNEYVCDSSNWCTSKIITCNAGDKCVDGKCVPAVPCTDSDNGKEYYTSGTCKDGSGCSGAGCTDSCVSSFGLKEYYCSGNSCLSETIPCPGGAYCAYGVCEPVTPAPTIGPTPSGSCTDPDLTDTAKPIGSRTDIYTKTSCTSTKNCASPGCSDDCIGGQLGEMYCAGSGQCSVDAIDCPTGYTCKDGVCKSGTATPVPTPAGGGCHYWASNFGVCSSGCPPEKWNMKWMCCEEAGASSGCEGDSGPGCVSWNPAIGETPCCSADGYRVCSATQECIDGDCVDICANAAYSKYTDPYCSKCSHCVDGLLNCGETEIDECGKPCTLVQTQTCITPPSYGKDLCGPVGHNKCDFYCPGTYGTDCVSLKSCAYDEYSCIYECTKTVDVFNQDSCYDNVQNCGEPCLDGGPNCVSGTETGYAPTYDVEPSLSNTIFYVDENILCSDGIDNDHDCAIDCADSDCAAVPTCQDTIPPNITIEMPLKGATIWNPATIKVKTYDNKPMTTSYIVVKMDGVPIHQFLPGECWGSGKKANPYTCTWTWPVTPAQMGQRTLQAEAKDWKSNLGMSDAISVTVGCASTFDCVTRYGPKNYCPGTSHVCTPCLRDQDFYCPDLECLDVDLDCCSTTVSCPSGLYCELGENTCYAKRGNFCSKQEDCQSGQYCSLDAQVCVNNDFIFLKPHFLKAKVGTLEALQVVMSDPVNRTGSYDLSISGTGKNYAKFFGTQTKISVSLKAGEVKTIPVIFSAGAIGTYTLEVEAIDTVYYRDSTTPPGGIRSVPSQNTKASVTVETDTKTPFLVSSPGPTIPGLLALALLASLFIFRGGRRK